MKVACVCVCVCAFDMHARSLLCTEISAWMQDRTYDGASRCYLKQEPNLEGGSVINQRKEERKRVRERKIERRRDINIKHEHYTRCWVRRGG